MDCSCLMCARFRQSGALSDAPLAHPLFASELQTQQRRDTLCILYRQMYLGLVQVLRNCQYL